MPKTQAFKDLMKSVKKSYLGKQVPKKYQKDYGKIYDLDEIESVTYAIAKSRGIKIDRRKK